MNHRIVKCPSKTFGEQMAARYLVHWAKLHPESGFGGATGNSPIGVWREVFILIGDGGPFADAHQAVTGQPIVFLDEYFGALPSYYPWAWRNLRVGRSGGFDPDNVFVPRGYFFFDDHIVNGARLQRILDTHPDSWEAKTEVFGNGLPPEVRIKQTAGHPVLRKIRDALDIYEALVQQYSERLQILGIGVEGHIGFVERGAAAEDTTTMLVRLSPSTLVANRSDFAFKDEAGDPITFEPATFAITQGIRSVLSAGTIMMLAWGAKKREAVKDMLLGTPGPQNPAAWLQTHDDVVVFVDADAFGSLDERTLRHRGWQLEIPG